MHLAGRIVFALAGLLFIGTGLWLADTSQVLVKIGGAGAVLVGAALLVLAFGTRTDWNRWTSAQQTSPLRKRRNNATEETR